MPLMPPMIVERFIAAVLRDQEVLEALCRHETPTAFEDACLRQAAAWGLPLTREDLHLHERASHRDWMERRR